jgi:predicted 2-oxoglutarate/Fe(II)-dependent dioxygenase YbiX
MQPTVINNFISKEQATNIHMFLRSTVELNPMGVLSKQLHPFNQFINDPAHEVYNGVKEIVDAIQNEFGFAADKISINRVLYQVLREGEELGYHTDAYGGVDGYGVIGYSALLYLTDDYEGGEILFYDNDTPTAYKPELGTLIYFKGDENYPHSVNKIISGERANIILFFDVKK